MSLPNCPKCNGEYTYIDGVSYICPECAYEWAVDVEEVEEVSIKDSNGNALAEGDYVTVIKGGRIDVEAKDHEIDCKVPGVGGMKLTAMFTKKV